MSDDQSLVSRIQSGDRQAFRLLIKQYERLVAHMVGRLVSQAEDREEICQDVFMKVYKKLDEFKFQSKLSTWIATIAYRHAVNHLRKKKIIVRDILDEENFTKHFLDHNDNPQEALSEKQTKQYILQMIEQLPVQYKTVLTLYHLDGKSYMEIYEITGMPEGTVKNYLFRARTMLKERLINHLGKEWEMQ